MDSTSMPAVPAMANENIKKMQNFEIRAPGTEIYIKEED